MHQDCVLKAEREQVETFLHTVGDSADNILTTLEIDENTATYEVKTALNGYYKVCTNDDNIRVSQ